MQDGWKLIHHLKPGTGDELYDLKSGPDELTNRIGEPQAKERLTKLRVALKTELERTQAGFSARTE